MLCFVVFLSPVIRVFFFFFNDPSTTEIYTLSLHDALPILLLRKKEIPSGLSRTRRKREELSSVTKKRDRKSTRLNSSHRCISYAVFCLKKKKKKKRETEQQQERDLEAKRNGEQGSEYDDGA